MYNEEEFTQYIADAMFSDLIGGEFKDGNRPQIRRGLNGAKNNILFLLEDGDAFLVTVEKALDTTDCI